jgi:hypothetical protein
MKLPKLDAERRKRIVADALTFFDNNEEDAALAIQEALRGEQEESPVEFDHWRSKAALVLAALQEDKETPALLHYVDLLWAIRENWEKGIRAAQPIVEQKDKNDRSNRQNSHQPRANPFRAFLLTCLRAEGGDTNPTALKRRAEHLGATVEVTRMKTKVRWLITLPTGETKDRDITSFLSDQRKRKKSKK